MSNNPAKTHNAISLRAKARAPLERKIVHKSVLGNPFHTQWSPSVPVEMQSSILAHLVALVDGVGEYRKTQSDHAHRKRKAARVDEAGARRKRKKGESPSDAVHEALGGEVTRQDRPSRVTDEDLESQNLGDLSSAPLPSVLRHITVGINDVTKRLEMFARSLHQVHDTALRPPIRAVFVCCADIDPPALVAHLPQLIATCNSISTSSDPKAASSSSIKLVPLSKGAELALAKAIGLRRAAVLAIDDSLPHQLQFDGLLESIPILKASWLSTPTALAGLERTHIKQLRTTAPKDMKHSKEQRAEERALAKSKKGKT
ncbi:hypothetical protein HETIRDRAFT_308446 [Heterobasidion irregulare TC 32-1]|uniref:Uncharacterized protein n=1 Tax=Heterobasidion irregulare (strain TC 32-1) TaxID=747525 RepID=W4KMC5_HETIT|nr:uncharacterized protein HETIRDRAFT_308446 [Heterobasidion irregulare TC 32-1]ETW86993.1 hypothetical protein HETIRDRAFT_308446 [Heterobasidion irregulare TC 32-1]